MHQANVTKSHRLQLALKALRRAGARGLTTRELGNACHSEAPGTDASELRHNGFEIDCQYEGRTSQGRKVYRYRLLSS